MTISRQHGVESVVDLGDLELLELDGGQIEGEPHRERDALVRLQKLEKEIIIVPLIPIT